MRYRDDLKKKIIDQESIESKYDYVDMDDVTDVLNDIEERINRIIVEMDEWNFSHAQEKLKELSDELY